METGKQSSHESSIDENCETSHAYSYSSADLAGVLFPGFYSAPYILSNWFLFCAIYSIWNSLSRKIFWTSTKFLDWFYANLSYWLFLHVFFNRSLNRIVIFADCCLHNILHVGMVFVMDVFFKEGGIWFTVYHAETTIFFSLNHFHI